MAILYNVPINELVKVLSNLSKHTPLCNIRIEDNSILFQPVYDDKAIKSNTKIKIPKEDKEDLDPSRLDDLI